MSQAGDADDFLGWAPDLGSWETTAMPAASIRPEGPVATPPQGQLRQPEPAAWARPLPSAPVAPPAPVRRRPTARRPDPPSIVPIVVAFGLMLASTLWMALKTALSGPDASPVGLLSSAAS